MTVRHRVVRSAELRLERSADCSGSGRPDGAAGLPGGPGEVPVAVAVPARHGGAARVRVDGHVADPGEGVEALGGGGVEVGAAVGGAALADVSAVPAGRVDELAGVGDAYRPRDLEVVSGAGHPLDPVLLHDDFGAAEGGRARLAEGD